LKSEKFQCEQGSSYSANNHKNTSVCVLQQTSLLLAFSFVQGRSFRWKFMEGRGHRGAWSVCLWRVRSRELVSLLLLTWYVTLGKPRFLYGPRSSLPVTVRHSQ